MESMMIDSLDQLYRERAARYVEHVAARYSDPSANELLHLRYTAGSAPITLKVFSRETPRGQEAVTVLWDERDLELGRAEEISRAAGELAVQQAVNCLSPAALGLPDGTPVNIQAATGSKARTFIDALSRSAEGDRIRPGVPQYDKSGTLDAAVHVVAGTNSSAAAPRTIFNDELDTIL